MTSKRTNEKTDQIYITSLFFLYEASDDINKNNDMYIFAKNYNKIGLLCMLHSFEIGTEKLKHIFYIPVQ
jgi:hypothetical protein